MRPIMHPAAPLRRAQPLLLKLSIALAAVGLSAACATGGGDAPEPTSAEGGGFAGNETPQSDWPFDIEQCGVAEYGKRVAGSMLVVLDRSGSMAYQWLDTRTAVVQMMTEANPELMVGLLPFPALGCDYDPLATCLDDPNGSGCEATLSSGCCGDVSATPAVPLAPALAARDAAWEWFQGQPVDGFTPTLSALTHAYSYMSSQPSDGQRYVVLFTDGAPTLHDTEIGPNAFASCGEEGDILSAVTEAATGSNSVKTFAIGAPGSWPAASLLSEIALRGGTARTSPCDPAFGECHYVLDGADFAEELERVLNRIAGLVGDCTFDIPAGNDQANRDAINVGIESASGLTPVYRDSAHIDGWDFVDASKAQLQLHGAACDAYNSAPANNVVVVLGCETLVR